MSTTFQFIVDYMVGRREIELVVTYSFLPGRPATPPAYSHGGLPPEDPEVEIVSVTHDGKPFTLSDEEEEALREQACERAAEDWAEHVADKADYYYEQRRDDQMLERWERGQ